MTLKIKLKQRWITSVLKAANASTTQMPWTRGQVPSPSSLQRDIPPRKPRLIQA